MNIVTKKLNIDSIDIIRQYLENEDNTTGITDSWNNLELSSFLDSKYNICIGAFYEHQLVGFVLTFFGVGINKVYIENIFVHPNFRQNGIGTLLIETLFNYYNKYNNLRFVALVNNDNLNAQKLFETCKFIKGCNMIWFQKKEK